ILERPTWCRPRTLLGCVAIGYVLVSMYAVSHAVERWIAAPFHPLTRADVPPGRTAVWLLGSGSYRRLDWSGAKMSVLDPIGLERTLEAARVYRLVEPDFVISSGGGFDADSGEDAARETRE